MIVTGDPESIIKQNFLCFILPFIMNGGDPFASIPSTYCSPLLSSSSDCFCSSSATKFTLRSGCFCCPCVWTRLQTLPKWPVIPHLFVALFSFARHTFKCSIVIPFIYVAYWFCLYFNLGFSIRFLP